VTGIKIAGYAVTGAGRAGDSGMRPVGPRRSWSERRGPALGGKLERADPAASSPVLPGGQHHAVPCRQEYHRIRGIGSILQPAGRRSRMRRARCLRVGMKGENIASTSTFLPLFRRSFREKTMSPYLAWITSRLCGYFRRAAEKHPG